MKSEPSLPEDAAPMGQPGPAEAGWLSIDGESIPFTMQAEVGHMTIDEAIASGLFDLPDEPGMVRIPISMNVLIPNHLLFPPESEPEPPADHNFPQYRNGVLPHLPGSPQGSRFSNYPRDIAAYNVLASFKSDMSPVAVAPVPGLPAAVVAAAGRGFTTSPVADSSILLDADMEAELRALALVAARSAAVGGPMGPVVAGILWPTPTAKNDDRPLAIRELAQKRAAADRLQGRLDGRSAFTTTPLSGRPEGTSLPAPLPPLPGFTPPQPLPPLAGFTPGSTPLHTTLPGTSLGRPSLADAQVNIAPEVGAASNILERNELGRRMEEAGTIAPGEVAHHTRPQRWPAEWGSRSRISAKGAVRPGNGPA